jgi:hypothetical protein
MISNVGVGHTIVPSILVCKGNGENSKQIATKASDEPNSLEISLHSLPKPLHREFHHVFNETYNDPKFHQGDQGEGVELLAIPTNQRARKDLVAVGDDVEAEKDRLLNVVSVAVFLLACIILSSVELFLFSNLVCRENKCVVYGLCS